MQAERKRPTGVTVIAILGIISGIIGLVIGIGLVLIGPFLSQVSETDMSGILENERFSDVNSTDLMTTFNQFKEISGYFHILGIILIALAIASFVVSWGLLKGKGWAWISAIILSIIGIVIGVIIIVLDGTTGDISSVIGQIMGIIINGIVLWYLHRQNVKSYFGRVKIKSS